MIRRHEQISQKFRYNYFSISPGPQGLVCRRFTLGMQTKQRRINRPRGLTCHSHAEPRWATRRQLGTGEKQHVTYLHLPRMPAYATTDISVCIG